LLLREREDLLADVRKPNRRVFIAQSARIPIACQKTCISLFEITLTHQAWQKRWPSLGVSLRLNVVCEFKRAGFLEGEAVGTTLLIGLKSSR